MSSSSTEEAVDANPPFSGHIEDSYYIPADLILRATAKGSVPVDFHVHKWPLSFVSEVFCDMFPPDKDTPEEAILHPEELKDGKPVVIVSDSSPALEILLRLCYPFLGNFQPATLHGVEGAISAAEKYQIKPAVAVLRAMLMNFMDTEPYWVFGIALRRKAAQAAEENLAAMDAIANAAALATLKGPFLARREDIDVSSTALLVQLYDLRATCGNAAAKFAADYADWINIDDYPDPTDRDIYSAVWWNRYRDYHNDGCGPEKYDAYPDTSAPIFLYPAKWFMEHMKQVSEALKTSPTEQQVREKLLDLRGTMYHLSKCAKCEENALADLKEFVLDDLVNKVVAHNLTAVQNMDFYHPSPS
ncbi:hypothetical protein DFH06DRAFT_364309 [Mycena polygramma]|nr:hypothetical protein DFH06DRAFT_364309 [Mycena polygramma]